MRRLPILALVIGIPFATPASSSTFVVTPDGTGDLPTIQAAVVACTDGDIIELTDGTFRGPGNRDIDYLGKAITIRSQGGNSEVCVIDCEGSEAEPHRGVIFISGESEGSILRAVSVQNGWAPSHERGGAIRCENGSAPSIESCVFSRNVGAAISYESQCGANLTDCFFVRNEGYWGGAIQASGVTLAIIGCGFIENVSDRGAAALHAFGSTGEVTGCDFIRNGPGDVGAVNIEEGGPAVVRNCLFEGNIGNHDGALRFFLSPHNQVQRCTFIGNSGPVAALSSGKISRTYIESCTFYGNVGPRAIHCGNILVTLDNTIVAGTINGVGVECPYDDVVLSCTDIHGNDEGDWVGRIADQYGVRGNMSEDPLFCDPVNGDLRLDANSPCAPFSEPNAHCDLIGAWPVGCGGVPARETTWGSIKSSGRR